MRHHYQGIEKMKENGSSKGVGHKSKSSSMCKYYDKNHAGAVPEDLISAASECWKNARTNLTALLMRYFT